VSLAPGDFLALNILSPGPNVLNTLTSAMGSGRRAGLFSALGVGLGIGGWCLGMSLGMAAVFALVPLTARVLTVAGALLLAWFAARYLAAAWRGFGGGAAGGAGGAGALRGVAGLDGRASFLRSLAVNALNPKALTTWLVVLTIFPVAQAGAADIALLCAGASALSTGIHAVYALVFSTAPAARAYLRAAWAVNGAVGLFFLAVAAKLLAGAG
jgi:threonine/homoserine/homoserine lactone efflux protein